YTVIVYRVIDTIIGASLAWLASRLLWPSWEREGVTKLLATALKAIREYLQEEVVLFREGKTDGLAYRLARRQAFVGLGELEATYARVLREPGGGAAQSNRLSDVVTDAHRILSVVAHIGTLLRYSASKLETAHVNSLTHDLAEDIASCYQLVRESEKGQAQTSPGTDAALTYFREGEDDPPRATFLMEYDYLKKLVADLKSDMVTWLSPGPSPIK
ncbi:MAG: hypothetical protein WA952_15500, partial [Lewinella sp.]